MGRNLVAGLCLLLAFTSEGRGQTVGGIAIDADGVVRQAGELTTDEVRALRDAVPRSSSSVAQNSTRRCVSLRKLEEQIAEELATSSKLSPDVRHLAGLQRIDAVLIDRARGDVILVGPAGAWESSPEGRPCAVGSGRPVLELDDWLVALRYAFPSGESDDFIGCSIDPTPEGLAAFEKLMRGQRTTDASRAGELVEAMERAIGPQTISLFGVPAGSRFAQKLLAADYRLKRLALGHDPSPVKSLSSYLDLVTRNAPAGRVPQQRWWFKPRGDTLRTNAERTVWRFEPDSVEVATALKDSDSTKRKPGKVTREAQAFADQATRLFPELAAAIPCFAELSNLIALSLAAEIVHAEAADPAGTRLVWRPELLLDGNALPVAAGPVPRRVPALVNVRRARNGAWVFAISGGVEVRPDEFTRAAEFLKPQEADLWTNLQGRDSNWWWDARD